MDVHLGGCLVTWDSLPVDLGICPFVSTWDVLFEGRGRARHGPETKSPTTTGNAQQEWERRVERASRA